MARWFRIALLALLPVVLAACGGGDGIRDRVFPPQVSVQQLTQQDDGRWALQLRLQNFSNVAMRFDAIDATLRIDDAPAGTLRATPMLTVAPDSADVYELAFAPSSAAAERVRAALAARGSVAYALEGEVRTGEPGTRRDDFTFSSRLTAVPGLAGVLR